MVLKQGDSQKFAFGSRGVKNPLTSNAPNISSLLIKILLRKMFANNRIFILLIGLKKGVRGLRSSCGGVQRQRREFAVMAAEGFYYET